MNEARGQEGTADERSLHRRAQYLAIPLGDLAPVHRAGSPWISAWRRNSGTLLTAVALVLVAAGVVISAAPRTVSVYVDASHVYLGGMTLSRENTSPVPGYTMFSGDAVVLLSSARPAARAAGAATLDGVRVSGACTQVPQTATLIERCSFTVGGAHVTSRDTFDPSARLWRRTYSDRKTVEFAVPAGKTVIPIPLPIGR